MPKSNKACNPKLTEAVARLLDAVDTVVEAREEVRQVVQATLCLSQGSPQPPQPADTGGGGKP